MNILWHIRLYPPTHNSGAEWYAHELNRYLISQGHIVTVMLPKSDGYEFQGVRVCRYDRNLYNWADIVFTQLECTDRTICDAERYKKPVVFVAHNTFDYPLVRRYGWVGVILNSKKSVDIQGYYKPERKRIVLAPPVDPKRCKVETTGDCYTLINLCENKGADTFYKIAQLMPDKKFLGVVGSYHRQLIKELPNVEIMSNTADIREVYRKTRILLMPSRYESWGRTATEAIINGIPVIAHPTFGLEENLSYSGVWADRKNPSEWVEKINQVEADYQTFSQTALKRAEELKPDYTEFDLFLNQMVNDGRNNQ